MFKFVIGLGINGVSGAQLEYALVKFWPLDNFEIVPMAEFEGQENNVIELQQRAAGFAGRVQSSFFAETYFGVASGQVSFCLEAGGPTALARTDIVVPIIGGNTLPPQYLDPDDIRWQVTNRVCGLVSTEKAMSQLVGLIRKHCVLKLLSKPK